MLGKKMSADVLCQLGRPQENATLGTPYLAVRQREIACQGKAKNLKKIRKKYWKVVGNIRYFPYLCTQKFDNDERNQNNDHRQHRVPRQPVGPLL